MLRVHKSPTSKVEVTDEMESTLSDEILELKAVGTVGTRSVRTGRIITSI